jgi:hypothetical protein
MLSRRLSCNADCGDREAGGHAGLRREDDSLDISETWKVRFIGHHQSVENSGVYSRHSGAGRNPPVSNMFGATAALLEQLFCAIAAPLKRFFAAVTH